MQASRTTVIDRRARVVTYMELPAHVQAELGNGYSLRNEVFIFADGWLAIPVSALARYAGRHWHGQDVVGMFGAYLVWLRDDNETAIVGYEVYA